MFSLEPTKVIEKQFKKLEDKAKKGSLGDNEKDLLAKIYHCFLHLSDNPNHPSLNTSPYTKNSTFNSWLSRMVGNNKVRCYHSYIENESPSARRLYWYYDNGSIKLVGIARHPKKGSEKDTPKFKDLSEENFSNDYWKGFKDGYNSVQSRRKSSSE